MGHVGGKGDLEVVAGEGVNVFEVKLLFLLADVDFGEEEFKLSSEFTNDLQSFEILIFFDDDVLVLLVEEADCFLLVASEEKVDGLDRELHLKYLVSPEVNEI